MKARLTLILFAFLFTVPSYGQEAQKYFNDIESIVSKESISKNLYNRLDSLQSRNIPSRSGISMYLNRDVDFGYRHQRISLQINFERYNVDLLTRYDSVLMSVVSHDDYKKLNKVFYNERLVLKYLTLRNQFYQSDKKIKSLIEEIALDRTYAFYCGDGLPETEDGKLVNRLVRNKNFQKLSEMLSSVNAETQAYGVAGLEMLKKKGMRISEKQKEIIQYIKERNSEVVTCSGCITGLVAKLY